MFMAFMNGDNVVMVFGQTEEEAKAMAIAKADELGWGCFVCGELTWEKLEFSCDAFVKEVSVGTSLIY